MWSFLTSTGKVSLRLRLMAHSFVLPLTGESKAALLILGFPVRVHTPNLRHINTRSCPLLRSRSFAPFELRNSSAPFQGSQPLQNPGRNQTGEEDEKEGEGGEIQPLRLNDD